MLYAPADVQLWDCICEVGFSDVLIVVRPVYQRYRLVGRAINFLESDPLDAERLFAKLTQPLRTDSVAFPVDFQDLLRLTCVSASHLKIRERWLDRAIGIID